MYLKVDVAYRLGHVHAQYHAVDARVLHVRCNRQRLRHDGKAEPPVDHAAARAHLHLHAGFGRHGKHAAAKYAVGQERRQQPCKLRAAAGPVVLRDAAGIVSGDLAVKG